jgi:Holliday junction DNA helicase RuvA
MISSLRGIIGRVGSNFVEVEVGGVGYEVQLSKKNFELRIGDEIKLFIFTAVSENEVRLFGFETVEDLDLFKMLITVSGIGPRTAAGILGEKKSEEIIKAIGEAEVDFFKKIKGIGLKSAQRIIVDLKSKVGGLGVLDLKKEAKIVEDDLYLSLKQLGFERKEIEKVRQAMPIDLVVVEEQLGWCLKNLS